MKIYFVRHGQTTANKQNRVVHFDDRLNEMGQKQALELAEHLAVVPLDVVLVSPHKRTMETAEIIAKKLNKETQEIPLLGEKKWSSEIEGKVLDDPEVEKILNLLREKNATDPTWHYSDEENFSDIKKRANDFIDYVSTVEHENILAVSHEYFIKMVIATMMHGESLSFEIFRDFYIFTFLDNASLTYCEKKENTWKLMTLNEKYHKAIQ